MSVENAASHLRSLKALISPMYNRHARYVAIVAARRNVVAASPWKTLITAQLLSPNSTLAGAVSAKKSPITAMAPTVKRGRVPATAPFSGSDQRTEATFHRPRLLNRH